MSPVKEATGDRFEDSNESPFLWMACTDYRTAFPMGMKRFTFSGISDGYGRPRRLIPSSWRRISRELECLVILLWVACLPDT